MIFITLIHHNGVGGKFLPLVGQKYQRFQPFISIIFYAYCKKNAFIIHGRGKEEEEGWSRIGPTKIRPPRDNFITVFYSTVSRKSRGTSKFSFSIEIFNIGEKAFSGERDAVTSYVKTDVISRGFAQRLWRRRHFGFCKRKQWQRKNNCVKYYKWTEWHVM